jgi:hypothetical protein
MEVRAAGREVRFKLAVLRYLWARNVANPLWGASSATCSPRLKFIVNRVAGGIAVGRYSAFRKTKQKECDTKRREAIGLVTPYLRSRIRTVASSA